MHIEVPVPDVDDDRHRRFERRDVGEILFRAKAKVNASLPCRFQEVRDDVLESGFIGQKVIGTENAINLGGVPGQAPELPVRQRGRSRSRHGPR
jgi:hypothetical protein